MAAVACARHVMAAMLMIAVASECLAQQSTNAGSSPTALSASGKPVASDTPLPAIPLPFSSFASDEAAQRFAALLAETREGKGPDPADIADQRRFYQRYNDERLAEVQKVFPSRTREERIGGVPVHVVEPQDGVSDANADRVLINLHGGAFMWGAGSGALVEAIPIAVTGHIRVITVDYRLAPEHPYPAAVDDVEAVYRELLKRYPAANIGMYGCSAGGMLTAQATARLLSVGLPAPGAIGTFCGSGLPMGGDSATLGQLAVGASPMPADGALRLPYLATARADDPVAYPGQSSQLLARFPPTLLLAGGRDFSLSSLTTMQRRLLAVGVDAQLVVFDGLWHAFFVFPELPESREAYEVIVRFFDQRLGKAKHR